MSILNNYLLIILSLIITSLCVSIISFILILKVRKLVELFRLGLRSRLLRSYIKSIEVRKKRRLRKRYMVFEIINYGRSLNISKEELDTLVKKYFKELFGTTELSRSGLALITIDKSKFRGILKYHSTYRTKVLMTLALLQVKEGLIVNPLRTTGTLRKALKYTRIIK